MSLISLNLDGGRLFNMSNTICKIDSYLLKTGFLEMYYGDKVISMIEYIIENDLKIQCYDGNCNKTKSANASLFLIDMVIPPTLNKKFELNGLSWISLPVHLIDSVNYKPIRI